MYGMVMRSELWVATRPIVDLLYCHQANRKILAWKSNDGTAYDYLWHQFPINPLEQATISLKFQHSCVWLCIQVQNCCVFFTISWGFIKSLPCFQCLASTYFVKWSHDSACSRTRSPKVLFYGQDQDDIIFLGTSWSVLLFLTLKWCSCQDQELG